MIRALIFDRDLTLLYLDPNRLANLERRLRALAATLRFTEIFTALERWDGALPDTAAAEPRLWEDLARRLAERHQLDEDRQSRLVALLRPYYEYFVAYPDAAPALEELRRKGYRLAVLTNSPLPSVEQTLIQGGIDPGLFDAIASRASLGVAKPHPATFRKIAAQLNLPPEECALIDDQAAHVAAARSVGMSGWTLVRAGDRLDDLVSLAELPLLLQKGGARAAVASRVGARTPAHPGGGRAGRVARPGAHQHGNQAEGSALTPASD